MLVKTVAVVGLGNISKRHRSNIKKIFPKAQIVAVSSRGSVPSELVSDADVVVGSITEALAYQVDFAVIASPSPYHFAHSEKFLHKRIPLLVEKPVTVSLREAQLLLDLATEKNVPVAVGYCLRYLPSAQVVFDVLRSGKIGQVYNIAASVGQFLPDWRPQMDYRQSVTASPKLGGGALLELSHEFDYLQWFLGEMSLLHCKLRNTHELDLEVEELADVVLQTAEGVICNVHLDLLQKCPHRSCSIIGKFGRIEWDIIKNSVVLTTAEGKDVLYEDSHYDKNIIYLEMLNDFVKFSRGKEHNCATLEESKQIVSLISEMKQSATIKRV